MFRDKAIECISKSDLAQYQLKHLKETLTSAFKTSFYQKRLKKNHIDPSASIKTLKDLEKIPFTVKDDLRDSYPKGLLAVDMKDVVRIHTSSGTTGIPTVIYHTQNDLNHWTELVTRSLVACGVTNHDVFQNMMTYGMFTGGLGLHYGAERLGALVIPSSSGNTQRQLQLMKDFQTTVVHATPSFMFHLASKIKEFGYSREDLFLKKAFLGAEPHSENTRRKIEDFFKIDAYNSYGLSEMNGPGVAFECTEKNNMHLWEDQYILEIIDPKSGKRLPDGEEGELVLTTLRRCATPLLRYRTRDLTAVMVEPCPCGRTHRRISRITGRTDDMMIINGVNVFPSQIEQVIMKIPEVGNNYQICLTREGALDRLTVKVEIYSKLFAGDLSGLERLKTKIRDMLKASIIINAAIELHEPESLPAFELKAKRVVDLREKL
ncbi:MAG: phenylacetate--CoA ligase [Candidatus Omnitrophota bacterium]